MCKLNHVPVPPCLNLSKAPSTIRKKAQMLRVAFAWRPCGCPLPTSPASSCPPSRLCSSHLPAPYSCHLSSGTGPLHMPIPLPEVLFLPLCAQTSTGYHSPRESTLTSSDWEVTPIPNGGGGSRCQVRMHRCGYLIASAPPTFMHQGLGSFPPTVICIHIHICIHSVVSPHGRWQMLSRGHR